MSLQEILKSRKITQMQLAKMIGMTNVAIHRIVHNHTNPHPATKLKIEKALKINIWSRCKDLSGSLNISIPHNATASQIKTVKKIINSYS